MTPNRLLDHFDRIADAPDAIPRLRRFILDLAVRGKLVDQDPNDERASELLKRIQAEKERLVKNGKIGKQSLVRDDAEAALPFRVPETWNWTPATYPTFLISDLGRKIQTKDVLQAGKFPVVDQGKMFIRGYCNDSDKVIYVEEPVIIFGDHTRETKLVDFNFVVGADGVKILKPIQLVPSYYFLTLQWLPLDSRGYGRHFKLLRAMKIPIPPLAEQHRIVAKVDELMALCDRLEAAQAEREIRRDKLGAASLHRLNNGADADEFREHARFHLRHLPRFTTRREHIQQLRQTVLNLAVRGKLVPQTPGEEPASELIERIRFEKAQMVRNGKLKSVDAIPPTHGELPYQLPLSWSFAQLQSLCISVTDGDHLPPPKTSEGVPFLVIGNVRNQSIEFAGCRHVSEEYFSALDSIRRPKKGDILYTLVGSFGIPVTVVDDRRFCVQRHIGILRPSKLLDASYLRRALESQFVFDQAAVCATGIAQKTVPLSGLRRMLIPLPPLAEQHRIVAKVDELMGLSAGLDAQLATTQTESRHLLDAVLYEALWK